MVVRFKRKKVRKYRGSKTHGGGAMKKRRGAGNRGGRGNAGTGKRADQKKPSVWKLKEWRYGRLGFKSLKQRFGLKEKTISLRDLNTLVENLIKEGKVKENNISLDLAKFGYDKILGGGTFKFKAEIKVKKATEKALAKLEQAGCSVKLEP